MTAPSAIADLRRAREVLEASGDPAGRRVAAGIREYEAAAAIGLTLDRALGVAAGHGGESWWQAERRQARDEALRQLARACLGRLDPTAQAREVARLARRYECTAWPRDRALAAPRAAYRGKPAWFLFRAFQALDRMPGERQLARLLTTTSDRPSNVMHAMAISAATTDRA